jgi:hypothetical protein
VSKFLGNKWTAFSDIFSGRSRERECKNGTSSSDIIPFSKLLAAIINSLSYVGTY